LHRWRFYEIEFPPRRLSSETVEAALLEVGAQSITFVDRGDEPVLEPKPARSACGATLWFARCSTSPAMPRTASINCCPAGPGIGRRAG